MADIHDLKVAFERYVTALNTCNLDDSNSESS
jgi:hypothetical protein